ncbi:MAG: hypothetical protein K0R99_4775, partial [Microbacterium sp.]|uniref:hypothetical protein n=1 Tax=Microbacterium sp. TaxID=51671 RepID=UPI0026088A51
MSDDIRQTFLNEPEEKQCVLARKRALAVDLDRDGQPRAAEALGQRAERFDVAELSELDRVHRADEPPHRFQALADDRSG